jgi:hypothetical protein
MLACSKTHQLTAITNMVVTAQNTPKGQAGMVANKTRKEIIDLIADLRARFPESVIAAKR